MRVVWSLPARADLFGIAEWYEAVDPVLAETILDRIEAAATPLLATPSIGAPVSGVGRRKWRVKQTPFLLIYRPEPSQIRILRVRHVRQDWRREP